MKFNKRTLALLLALPLVLPHATAGKIYKWVDENGKVHYSDKPPKDQKKTEQLALPEAKEETAKTKSVSAQQRIRNANKWLNNSREKRQQKQQEKARAEAAKKKQQRECQVMRNELTEYQHTNVIYDYDKSGKRFYYTDEQREQFIENLKSNIKQQCEP
ncbi:DUF4124 domain-containing protein [Pleionea mediterranea]|jgi:2,3-bisphosphoglycerate-independent phosphoglycerate mutase|uniref:Uncharacterized protein DUF4124 n=1 Tax=Pleionea mediterranea TaxID=523701 RepID=A0A316FE68_9GAMM|nr:DUF4124 domain-containing protein [Pleionea mediterranea]PWK46425.1 uncharacterized protein DUF4124 [Pleionea mediterranea]